MKQLLTGKQMKQADTWSIKEFGMESLILMERAALCAAQHIIVGVHRGAASEPLLSLSQRTGMGGARHRRPLWQASLSDG